MNERLEERKRKLLEYLKEEYKEEPPKSWWHTKKPVYRTTWDFGNTQDDYRRDDYNVTIRKNKNEAAFLVAFLFLSFAWMFYPWDFKEVDSVSVFFMIVLFIISILNALDRRPKVIIDSNGLWTHKWSVLIPWNLIVATYIKEEDAGEDKNYQLIVHFYDAWQDLFCEANFTLGGLEISNEALAYYIEYWKIKTQKVLE